MISQLNFNIDIGIFEIFILRLDEKKISTATSKKIPFDQLGEKKPIWKKGVRYVLYRKTGLFKPFKTLPLI